MLKVQVIADDNKWRECQKLEIRHRGDLVGEYYDSGEPEDNSFYRDYNWIAGALENAYKRGVLDGKISLFKEKK